LSRPALAVVAVALVATACGGGSAPAAAPSPAPTATATATSQPGTGLIADVDRATVVAVCINLKEASQFVGTGIGTDQARAAVVAAIGQLSKPPHPTAALQLATALRQELRRHHLGGAVDTGLAWCTRHRA
jgi:hypothetical protein